MAGLNEVATLKFIFGYSLFWTILNITCTAHIPCGQWCLNKKYIISVP